MKNKKKIVKMVTLALLIALSIVLQVFATVIPAIATYALPLGMISIVVAAIMFGPIAGMICGFVWGLYVFFTPDAQAFMAYSVIYTFIATAVRGLLDGLFVAYVYKLFIFIFKKINNSEKVSIFITSIFVFVFNATVYFLCVVLMFQDYLSDNSATTAILLKSVFSVNFLISILMALILSPVIIRVCIAGKKILGLENKVNIDNSDTSDKTNNIYHL